MLSGTCWIDDVYGQCFKLLQFVGLIPIHSTFFFPSLLSVSVDPNDQKKTACYDIDVEVEDPLKSQMSSFLLSTANQQEIASLDNKVGPRGNHTFSDQTCLGLYPALIFTAVSAPPSDPRDHRVHQPAEDPEGLHAQLLQGPQGLHPGLAQIPEQRLEGLTLICFPFALIWGGP